MNELVVTEYLIKRFENKTYREAFIDANTRHLLAAQVRTMRISHEWSQQQLADKVGVSIRTISRLESAEGGVSLPMLLRIAAVFDVSFLAQFMPHSTLIHQIAHLSPATINPMQETLNA